MRWRPVLSMGVIVALGVAVWAALSAGNDDVPTTSTVSSSSTTTASTPTTTPLPTTTTSGSTTAPPTTSAPTTTIDPEARIEEVRLILEDLYYRWFDAIYRNDEEAVRDVVATSNNIADFREAVTTLNLERPPERGEIRVTDVEVLRDDSRCLVAFSTLDVSAWRGAGATTEGVDVLLPVSGDWRLATTWESESDLWQTDCEIEPDLP